jgi:hypothetical protein
VTSGEAVLPLGDEDLPPVVADRSGTSYRQLQNRSAPAQVTRGERRHPDVAPLRRRHRWFACILPDL